MSNFKVGDRVRVIDNRGDANTRVGDVGTVTELTGLVRVRIDRTNMINGMYAERWELITKETKPMARRTFKQLKDTPAVKKGGLWQEDCEDGTQPYSLINPVVSLTDSTQPAGSYRIRSIVEERPEWFVEVFKVEPEYMTREQLDRYQEFLKAPKKSTVKRGAYKKHPERDEAYEDLVKSKPGSFVRTPEMRAAQKRKMKAYWRKKKAGQL